MIIVCPWKVNIDRRFDHCPQLTSKEEFIPEVAICWAGAVYMMLNRDVWYFTCTIKMHVLVQKDGICGI
jgi:hypothetical protein